MLSLTSEAGNSDRTLMLKLVAIVCNCKDRHLHVVLISAYSIIVVHRRYYMPYVLRWPPCLYMAGVVGKSSINVGLYFSNGDLILRIGVSLHNFSCCWVECLPLIVMIKPGTVLFSRFPTVCWQCVSLPFMCITHDALRCWECTYGAKYKFTFCSCSYHDVVLPKLIDSKC